jgi:aminoglycoside phosphotransferase (APT) family kinase protein
MTDPILAKARHHRALSGLSDAAVYLMTEDGTSWFVRKAAREPAASPRLRLQMSKQVEFIERVGGNGVATPAVLNDGEVDGRFFFDMEFIQGTDGASFLRQASIPAVRDFTAQLCAYLDTAAALVGDDLVEPYVVLSARVDDVQERTGALDARLLDMVRATLEPVRAIGPVPTTFCHGDLTLENMVIDREGGVWLIDLLDSPLEHHWQDVAKLHQDLTGGWYLRRVAPIARSALDFVSSAVLRTTLADDERYGIAHTALLVTSFVRILPYAREDHDREMILERIAHLATNPESRL